MLRKGLVIAALFGALCVLPNVAHAQVSRGQWELTLGGAANNGPNFNGFSAAVNGSLGYFVTDALEFSVRQSVAYSDLGGSGWDGSTRLALDYHVPVTDALLPYVGANLGYVYGPNVRDTFEAAPEAGVKYFVNPSTFIYVSVEYQFFFNQNTSSGAAFKNGQFIYGLGIGFRF